MGSHSQSKQVEGERSVGYWDPLVMRECGVCVLGGGGGGGERGEGELKHINRYSCRATYSMTNLSLWIALLLLVYITNPMQYTH